MWRATDDTSDNSIELEADRLRPDDAGFLLIQIAVGYEAGVGAGQDPWWSLPLILGAEMQQSKVESVVSWKPDFDTSEARSP